MPVERTDSQGKPGDIVEAKVHIELTRSVVLLEDLAQFAGEGFGFAGISRFAAHEAAVMAGEHRRLLTK